MKHTFITILRNRSLSPHSVFVLSHNLRGSPQRAVEGNSINLAVCILCCVLDCHSFRKYIEKWIPEFCNGYVHCLCSRKAL